MNLHSSYNEYHLGDNLIHLHFLRHLAQRYPGHRFQHAVFLCHFDQLFPVVKGLENVCLIPVCDQPAMDAWVKQSHARNVWKNAGGYWQGHPKKQHYAAFYLEWFQLLACEMGLESPFTQPPDLLFDYPEISGYSPQVHELIGELILIGPERLGRPHAFDFLIVNSQPCSGQFRAFDSPEYLNPLIEELAQRYRVVTTSPVGRVALRPDNDSQRESSYPIPQPIPCTRDFGLTITDVGTLSMFCPYLVMIATGPCWPTFNRFNQSTVQLRLMLLDCGEDLGGMAPHTVQCNNRQLAREILQERELL